MNTQKLIIAGAGPAEFLLPSTLPAVALPLWFSIKTGSIGKSCKN